MTQLDLSPVGAVIFVFAMPNCPACHDYTPVLAERVSSRGREGFVFADGSHPLRPGQIPIIVYDVTTDDAALRDMIATYGITMTPTTLLLSRNTAGSCKLEGSLNAAQVDHVLDMARAVAT